MDIEETFGMDPIDIDIEKKLSKKAKEKLRAKKFGWTGFAEAFNNLIAWSTKFAPEKTQMIIRHFAQCQEYYKKGCQVEDIFKFSNEIRLKNPGLDSDWNEEKTVTEAYRKYVENPKKRRRSLFEKRDYSEEIGNGRGYGWGRGGRGRGRGRSPFLPRKGVCWNFQNGLHCSFGAACKFNHSGAPQSEYSNYTGQQGEQRAARGRGRGRGNTPQNYLNNYDNQQNNKYSKNNNKK